MKPTDRPSRRELLIGAGVLLVPALARADGSATAASQDATPAAKPADVNATEDLMREHGVIRRTLIVYEELAHRLDGGEVASAPTAAATALLRRFAEGYHEPLEERFIFPRFQKKHALSPLVQTLIAQHAAGRALTAAIAEAAQRGDKLERTARTAQASRLRAFVRMYTAHAAREDTVLFPAYHNLFDEKSFDALGDQFEEQEHQLLGASGFEGAVAEIAGIEAALGLADLAVFNPKG